MNNSNNSRTIPNSNRLIIAVWGFIYFSFTEEVLRRAGKYPVALTLEYSNTTIFSSGKLPLPICIKTARLTRVRASR